jgi:hypothetical protein
VRDHINATTINVIDNKEKKAGALPVTYSSISSSSSVGVNEGCGVPVNCVGTLVGWVVGKVEIGDFDGWDVVGMLLGKLEVGACEGAVLGLLVEGLDVGDCEGLDEVGACEGARLGLVVEGLDVGVCEGSDEVGATVGLADGATVGATLGDSDGATVGDTDTVGPRVGAVVVGPFVGVVVVGLFVGVVDGVSDGIKLGASVGAAAIHEFAAPTPVMRGWKVLKLLSLEHTSPASHWSSD